MAKAFYYYVCLKDYDTAERYLDRARRLLPNSMAVNPVEKDAIAGPRSLEVIARIAPKLGEPDRAIAALEKLLSIPHSGLLDRSIPFTPVLLRLDPMFDSLRSDARFQKLAGLTGTK